MIKNLHYKPSRFSVVVVVDGKISRVGVGSRHNRPRVCPICSCIVVPGEPFHYTGKRTYHRECFDSILIGGSE